MGVVLLLGTDDVGHRVVVRYRTPLGATDVLGELTEFGPERVTVRTERGELRHIRRSDIVAGKPVGPRPPRYSEMLALERIADRAWPAPVVEHLGEWLLRWADGWTNRANSALPLGEAGIPLADAVEQCRRFYANRQLPPKITVPLPVRRDVAAHLGATGWVEQPRVLVQTAPLEGIRAPGATAVELEPEPSPELLNLVAARKAGLPEAAWHVLRGVTPVRFAQARDADGAVVAVARGAVVDSHLHIGLVEVAPAARRQGLARAVSAALAAWALAAGATRAVLQVEEHNTAAVALYRSLGFVTHHSYVTFHLPATAQR